MTAAQLLQSVSWCLYVAIFVLVVARVVRLPTRANADITLFFGATTGIILTSTVQTALDLSSAVWLADVAVALLMLLPYLLMRLVADFSHVPTVVIRAIQAAVVVCVVAYVGFWAQLPGPITVLLVACFVVITGYDAWAFMREAGRSVGVTRRRLQAIAAGTLCVGLVLVFAGIGTAAPASAGFWAALGQVAGAVSAIAYFAGFAPPGWLRRLWQQPELDHFLQRAAALAHLPDIQSVVRAIESGVAASFGAPAASVGVWDPASARLRFLTDSTAVEDGWWYVDPHERAASGRAFLRQHPVLVRDLEHEDPADAELYRAFNARAALAAPITSGTDRLGVLVVHADREPLFATGDLELLRLLAQQAATILENRRLVDEAARVHAREESLRMKQDFLSSAAHDLKTPLTGILTQSQMLLRRAELNPAAPSSMDGLQRLLRETRRLKTVVLDLLDAAELEPTEGPMLIREETDLVELAREVSRARPRVTLQAPGPVVGAWDRARLKQVLEHLLDNALLYDRSDNAVIMRISQQPNRVHITVIDQGIGIMPEDLSYLFERFHRGRNVDDRRHAGLGLGLFVSRRIVELHGGRIWAESELGRGSTFHVEIPLAAPGPTASQVSGQPRMGAHA
jgi:signal transduction histidine kinase